MAVRMLPAGDRQPAAWKNGGGVTREVAADPPGADLADFDWRVSFAEVAAGGPFSLFAGVDRIITLVAGQGMELTVDGLAALVAEPYEPFAFPGDAAVDCRLLGGPIVDFNVMSRRGRVGATVEIAVTPRELVPPLGAMILVVALGGQVALSWQEDEPSTAVLERYDAAVLTEGTRAEIEPDGTAAVVIFAPIP